MPQACLNGTRTRAEHPGVPLRAQELAREAARGIEVEAGLASLEDVERLGEVLALCRRALVEVPDREPDEAVAHARRIEAALPADLPRMLHGEEAATWAVIADARARGVPFRIGLEDVLTLPDGSRAPGNGALVRAARR